MRSSAASTSAAATAGHHHWHAPRTSSSAGPGRLAKLKGADGDDHIPGGGDGPDIVNGNLGNDVLLGSTANDVITPATATTRCSATPATTTLFGDAGIDRLNGSSGNDRQRRHRERRLLRHWQRHRLRPTPPARQGRASRAGRPPASRRPGSPTVRPRRSPAPDAPGPGPGRHQRPGRLELQLRRLVRREPARLGVSGRPVRPRPGQRRHRTGPVESARWGTASRPPRRAPRGPHVEADLLPHLSAGPFAGVLPAGSAARRAPPATGSCGARGGGRRPCAR